MCRNNLTIIRMSQMVKKIKASRSTLNDWQNEKSPRYKPDFPKKIKLGSSMVGWLESDVDEWLLTRRNG